MPYSLGTTSTEVGVRGSSDTKTGVEGISNERNGVEGRTLGNGASGVWGLNGRVSSQRVSPGGTAPTPARYGVYGELRRYGTGAGVKGTSDSADGVEGETASSARCGVFGSNVSKRKNREPNAGGNGVLGVSLVPNASGVFGAHNNGGTGVAGFSQNGTGVEATSEFGAGMLARSTAGPAVYGISAQRAARFDGPVEINGDLIVNGKTLDEIISDAITKAIVDYDNAHRPPPPVPPPPPKPPGGKRPGVP
jgi:hypothetical protein